VWAVGNARVEPNGNAILVTKQASGSTKIDPLNGSVQCDCPNGDEASCIAAKYFLDLDAGGDLRDTASDLPQRMTPTRQH
jgi:hypothetical protein